MKDIAFLLLAMALILNVIVDTSQNRQIVKLQGRIICLERGMVSVSEEYCTNKYSKVIRNK